MARTKAIARKLQQHVDADGKPMKKPHRYRPGTVALREIRRYQKSTEALTSRSGYEQYVRNIPEVHEKALQFQPLVFEALQEAGEAFLTDLFRRAMIVAASRQSRTLHSRDLRAALEVLKGVGPFQ